MSPPATPSTREPMMADKLEERLDEFDRDEWRDVARLIRPDWTDEEFEDAWAEFQSAKQKRRAN